MTDFEANKARIIEELKALKITKCVIRYAGGGDSGQIEDVEAYKEDYTDQALSCAEAEKQTTPNDEIILLKIRNRLLGEKVTSLENRLEGIAYDALEHVCVTDWINNDGGGGTMTICADGSISIDHYHYVQETHETYYEC